jgi:hypothetical protein
MKRSQQAFYENRECLREERLVRDAAAGPMLYPTPELPEDTPIETPDFLRGSGTREPPRDGKPSAKFARLRMQRAREIVAWQAGPSRSLRSGGPRRAWHKPHEDVDTAVPDGLGLVPARPAIVGIVERNGSMRPSPERLCDDR